MTTHNHWGTYKSSLASWYIDFPVALWDRWADLLVFAESVFELGRREDVFCVDHVPPPHARGESLFGEVAPAARLSVFGPSGVEDRRVGDLGADLLALRPELPHTPHVPPLSVDGPLYLDRTGPVHVAIGIMTDIWFPLVVGINDDRDGYNWYDNGALAGRHTPRLNLFLSGVRGAAASLGATWSHEAVTNINYTRMVDDNGIRLDALGISIDRVAAWAERICLASTTDAAEMVHELAIPGLAVPRFGDLAIEPPPAGTIECKPIVRNGVFARLDLQLADPTLTHADLERRFGTGTGGPRVHADSYFGLEFGLDLPGAPYGCTVFADFAAEPAGTTLVSGLSLRRRPARPK